MTDGPGEVREVHTRLQRCTLAIEECRAYWAHTPATPKSGATEAFQGYWFGDRSLPRARELLSNMRVRFDAFPPSLEVLHRWPHMGSDTRRVICHWHLQLADPLYRRFTGVFLPERRASSRPELTRAVVTDWLGLQLGARWTMATRIKMARNLLTAAFSAGLLSARRDPRPLSTPRVPDDALEYFLYLLRQTKFTGSLLDNPYWASVDLGGPQLESRLRGLPGLEFKRQGSLLDPGWRHANLASWADAHLPQPGTLSVEVAA